MMIGCFALVVIFYWIIEGTVLDDWKKAMLWQLVALFLFAKTDRNAVHVQQMIMSNQVQNQTTKTKKGFVILIESFNISCFYKY